MRMDKLFQIVWNTVLQFGLTYLAAKAGGTTNTVALGAGATAVLSGQVALNQTAPKDKGK